MGMAVVPVKLCLWMVESEFHVIFHVSQSVLFFVPPPKKGEAFLDPGMYKLQRFRSGQVVILCQPRV